MLGTTKASAPLGPRLGFQVFHIPCPIEIDEVPVMRFEYVSHLLPVLLRFGSNSNSEVPSPKLLFVPRRMRDFIVTKCFLDRAHDTC